MCMFVWLFVIMHTYLCICIHELFCVSCDLFDVSCDLINLLYRPTLTNKTLREREGISKTSRTEWKRWREGGGDEDRQ